MVAIHRLVFTVEEVLADMNGDHWIAKDRNAFSSWAFKDSKRFRVGGRAVLPRPALCMAATRVQALTAPAMVRSTFGLLNRIGRDKRCKLISLPVPEGDCLTTILTCEEPYPSLDHVASSHASLWNCENQVGDHSPIIVANPPRIPTTFAYGSTLTIRASVCFHCGHHVIVKFEQTAMVQAQHN